MAESRRTTAGGYAAMLGAELPKEAPPSAGWRAASFFCCAGGVDLGFRSAGIETVFANDVDARAAGTFAANLGHQPLVRDVRRVGARDYGGPPVDVLTGGFPCVTFSLAGRRKGVVDDVHGKLYLELCRVISEFRPRYFVAENVAGMLSANGGNAVKLVLAAFLRLGYRTAYELVNMAEHGVPQARVRVIFVGVRADQWRGSFAFPRRTRRLPGDKRAAAWLSPAATLAEAIEGLTPPGQRVVGQMYGDAVSLRADGTVSPKRSNYEHTPPNGADAPSVAQVATLGGILVVRNHSDENKMAPRRVGLSRRVAKNGQPSPTVISGGHAPGNDAPLVVVRNHDENAAPTVPSYNVSRPAAHVGKASPTMVAGSRDGNAHPFVVGGAQLRRMTVRECARVQSFPDWFEFRGTMADGYRQVGNAVPPLYAKRLALALLEYDRREVLG